LGSVQHHLDVRISFATRGDCIAFLHNDSADASVAVIATTDLFHLLRLMFWQATITEQDQF
jgi:hypothetical protein